FADGRRSSNKMSRSGQPPSSPSSRAPKSRRSSTDLPDAVAPTPPGFSPIWPRSKEEVDPDMRQQIIALGTDATISFFLIIIAVVKFIFQSIKSVFDFITDTLADAIRPFYLKCCVVHAFYKKHPDETKQMVVSAYNIACVSYKAGLWTFSDAFYFVWDQTVGKMQKSAAKSKAITPARG
ncbi:hypothetical protein PFISCL1PPCAC_7985, partial [Pristionchus fissidentatus]